MANIEDIQNNNTADADVPDNQTEGREVKALTPPSPIGFEKLQVDACEDKDVLSLSPICPSCEKDENAPEIDWVLSEEPYLDKRTCEYVAVLEKDLADLTTRPDDFELDANFYWDKDVSGEMRGYSSIQDWASDPRRIRAGIRHLLRFFEKKESEKTVCAFGGCSAASLKDMRENRAVIEAYKTRMEGVWPEIDRFTRQVMPWLNVWLVSLGPTGWVAMAGLGIFLGVGRSLVKIMDGAIDGLADLFGADRDEKEEQVEKLDRMIKSVVGSDILEQLEYLKDKYGEVNPYALEWTAFVPEQEKDEKTGQWTGQKGVYINNDSGIVRYQVRIPATSFNLIPPEEKDPEEEDKDETTEEEILLDNKDWRIQFSSMKTGLTLYQYEYDLFRVKEGGSIVYAVEGGGNYNSINFKEMRENLVDLKEALETFLNKNDYAFSYEKINPAKWFHTTVENVKIELKSDGDKPLHIKRVFVTADGCPPKRITRGIKAFRRAAYNPTILYLLAKKDTSIMAMKADEQMPLVEFAKQFIFPEIKVNMGSYSKDTEEDKSLLGCVGDTFPLTSAGDWVDLIQDLLVGTWDVFRDELTKRMCEDGSKAKDPGLERFFASAEAQKKFELLYKEEKARIIEKRKKKIKLAAEKKIQEDIDRLEASSEFSELSSYQQDVAIKEIEARQSQYEDELLEGEMQEIMQEARTNVAASDEYEQARKDHPYFGDFKAIVNEKFDYEESLIKLFKDFILDNKKRTAGFEGIGEAFLADIGWCGMVIGLKKLLGCLFGQLSLEDIIKILFDKAMAFLTLDQFYFVFAGLPFDEQVKVQEDVEKALKGFGDGISVDMDTYMRDKANAAQKLGALESSYDTEKMVELNSPLRPDGKTPKKPEEYQRDLKRANDMFAKYQEKLAKLQRDTRPQQGSIGDATANVVGIVIKAYLKALKRMLRLSTMLRLIRSIPGINLIPDALTSFFSCPGKSIVNPPLKKLLDFKKFKVDFCDPTKPLFNFRFPQFFLFNPFRFLMDAFVAALKRVLMRILLELALKFLIALEELLCKLLAGLGKGALNFVTGNFDSNPFLEAFKEAFCGPNTPDDVAEKALQGTMTAAGVTTPEKAAQAAVDITAAMAMSVTTDEMVGMWIDVEKDPSVIRRISNAVKLGAPEYADIFSTPEKINSFFRKMSDLLPNDHKQALRDAREIDPIVRELPLIESICPSEAEIDQWNNLRQANLEARGVSPEDAEQQIQDYMDRTRRALGDVAEALAQGPDEIVSGEVQKLLRPTRTTRDNWGDLPNPDKDPACDDYKNKSNFGNQLFREPEEAVRMSNAITDRMIDSIGTKFNADLAGFGGMLSWILADTRGNHLGWHNIWANFFLTRGFYYDSKEQEEANEGTLSLFALFPGIGYFPKTVGYYLFEQIKGEDDTVEYESKSKDARLSGVFQGEIEDGFDPGWLDKELSYKYSISSVEDHEFEIKYEAGSNPLIGLPTELPAVNTAGYCSQVLIDKGGYNERHNFDYKINVVCDTEPFLKGSDYLLGFTPVLSLIQEVGVEPEVEAIFADLNPDSSPDTKYRVLAFNHFFNRLNSEMSDNFISFKGSTIFDKNSSFLHGLVKQSVLDIIPRDGQACSIQVPVIEEVEVELRDGTKVTKLKTGDGTEAKTIPYQFLFGYAEDDLLEEHFEYVGPEGEEYDYAEEEKVLGKMKVPNDRVHILDPKVYGGQYKYPPLYIEEPKHRGWLEIAKLIDPEIAQCPDENILKLSKVKEFVINSKNRMKMDERLFEARGDCFLEVPFDKILGRESFAMIEGCIKSLIRTIVVEQVVPTLPVISVVEFNERNYDDSLFQLVTQRLADDLKTTDVIFSRKIEKRNYYLAFLEQSVQMYQRMYDRGDIEERPPGVITALNEIRELQENFKMLYEMWKFPRKSQGVNFTNGPFDTKKDRRIICPGEYYDMEKGKLFDDGRDVFDPFDFSKTYAHYCALAYQTWGEPIFYSTDQIKFRDLGSPRDSAWNFASKMFAIRSVEEQCKKVLAQLVKIEFLDIIKDFTKEWQPDIVDINRYILNTPLFLDNPLKNFGTRDMEERVANGEIPSYGEVAEVISDVLQTSDIPIPEDGEDGRMVFKLERYIRVKEKTNRTLPPPVRDRDYRLRDVVNIIEFQEFIDTLKENDDYKEYFLSDIFGDAMAMYSVDFTVFFNSGVDLNIFESYFPEGEEPYDEDQRAAIERGSLSYIEIETVENEMGDEIEKEVVRTPTYNNILVPDQFLDLIYPTSENPVMSNADLLQITEGMLPVSMRGSVGVKYGLRIVAKIPQDAKRSASPTSDDLNLTKREKSYFFGGTANNLIVPIAAVEIDVLDSKVKEFGHSLEGGESFYPFDLDCLLRKLIETPEYKALFQYIFNVKAGVSLPALVSNMSFLDSIGKADGWDNVVTYDADGENESDGGFGSDGESALDWDKKNFVKTKKYIRSLFSSNYLADDFEEDEIELSFNFIELLKIWKASLFGTFKTWGKWLSWKWKRNLQDRPYNKDGEECKSEYDNLF